MTIIVPASAKVPLRVSGNAGCLAMRHCFALRSLFYWLDQPLIAASTNISGEPICRSGIPSSANSELLPGSAVS